MSNKIDCGIITFHRAHNYGAVLQAYALQKAINDLGFIAGFIDYQHESLRVGYSLYPTIDSITSFRKLLSYFKRWLNLLLDYRRKKVRYDGFEFFINRNFKNIDFSKEINIKNIVLGSDQIWNSDYTGGIDPIYYGDHEKLKVNNILSYAASMGIGVLNKSQEVDFKKQLQKINSIGVREDSLKNYIESISNIRTEVNLDPTLLLDKRDWDKIQDDTIKIEGDYLLVYEVHTHKETNKYIENISNKYNLKVVRLSSKTDYKIDKDVISCATPEQFITLFKNASYILTTSFHGTVFSIINEKKFITLEFGNDIDIRSNNLVCKLGLENRLSSRFDINNDHICYSLVTEKLDVLRAKSKSFLLKALLK